MTNMKTTTNPQADINTMLAAGANVSALNEAHELEGFGSGSDVRPESWCAVLIQLRFKRFTRKQGKKLCQLYDEVGFTKSDRTKESSSSENKDFISPDSNLNLPSVSSVITSV